MYAHCSCYFVFLIGFCAKLNTLFQQCKRLRSRLESFLTNNAYLYRIAMQKTNPQQQFAANASAILATDEQVIGLAVGGSWLSDDMDEFSDLDLVLVQQSNYKKTPNKR